MQTQTVSAKTGAVRGKDPVTGQGGFSLAARAVDALLAARAVDALLAGDYRFEREFNLEAGGAVWGVYKGGDAQPSYAVDVERTQAGELVISRCNCPDMACRKRVCKHMVLLSVVSGYALRVGPSVLRFASALLTSPSALAQAVTERAAAVDRAERGLPPLPLGLIVVYPGQPCPRCGVRCDVEHDAGMRADYLCCQRPGCLWECKVSYNYDLMAWVRA